MGRTKHAKRAEAHQRKQDELRRRRVEWVEQHDTSVDVTSGLLRCALSGELQDTEHWFALAEKELEFRKLKEKLEQASGKQKLNVIPDFSSMTSTEIDEMNKNVSISHNNEQEDVPEDEDPLMTYARHLQSKGFISDNLSDLTTIPTGVDNPLETLSLREFVAEIRIDNTSLLPHKLGQTIFVDDYGLKTMQQNDSLFSYTFIRGIAGKANHTEE
jgi:hypothetical protein